MTDAVRDRIWAELCAAPGDRTHPWRLPVLATVTPDGAPDARTVVLRASDRAAGTLDCFTDARSPKVAQLRREARAVLVFWHPGLRWQLRVRAAVETIVDGPAIEAAWQRIASSAAAADYLAPAAPGTPVADAKRAGPASAHHLCVLRAQVEAIDWLALGDTGEHQRILFEPGVARHVVP